ncbi:MAG: hypothetical protein ABJA82_08530 [Myxococcales bacterium]
MREMAPPPAVGAALAERAVEGALPAPVERVGRVLPAVLVDAVERVGRVLPAALVAAVELAAWAVAARAA